VVEVGQLRRWKDGFPAPRAGTMCLVTEHFDHDADDGFGYLRQRTFTVLMGDQDPWFYEQELEEYTVLVE
jgi:hypothetical protein